jgi:hypothetical protein
MDGRAAVLKRDVFGTVERLRLGHDAGGVDCVERDTTTARWWVRWVARRLARREARALEALRGLPSVPGIVRWDGRRLQRTWLEGEPCTGLPCRSNYYPRRCAHGAGAYAAGVLHNDLAKEPNWLVTPDGSPALVDFQLAARPRHRGRFFRMLAYDDLRHLLKHKRSYCPERLTERQRRILERRSAIAVLWSRTGKPVYRLVTRRILGWSDREGAGDRGQAQGSTVSKSSVGWSPGRK